MASVSVTNTFSANTTADASQVNTNFNDIVTWLNNRNSASTSWDGLTAASPTFTGVATFAAGTQTNPSLTFTGNTNTGFYQEGTNVIGATSNGTETLSIGSYIASLVNGFSAPASTGASVPPYTFAGDLDTGLYHIGANTNGLASAGSKQAEFGPYGSSDDTQYQLFKFYSSASATNGASRHGVYSTTGVTNSAKTIYGDGLGDGGILIVYGNNGSGKQFTDILVALYTAVTPVLLNKVEINSPDSRTYSMSGNGTFQVTMGGGTYAIRTVGLGTTQR